MFLTRMELNKARRKTPELLANRQHMHAAVMAAFGAADAAEGRVLWRVDPPRNVPGQYDPWLWIVSPQPPDLTHLVEQAGRPTAPARWQTAPYDTVLRKMHRGSQWAFRLHANPTHKVRTERMAEGSDTKVMGHQSVRHQLAWLVGKADRLGVRWLTTPGVDTDGSETEEPIVTITGRANVVFPRGGRRVTLTTATYEGRFEVLEPEKLTHELTHGIGRAKAYGCGLMTVVGIR